MPIARRNFLVSAAIAPILTSCATDFPRYKSASLSELAANLGICSATYATLKAGKVQNVAVVSGCQNSELPPVDSVFQAASLTKPVVAYAALQLALAGQLDLHSPVSRFLPRGYTHFHSVLARSEGDRSDLVSASTLSAIPLVSLLNHTSGLPNWSDSSMVLAFVPGGGWQYSGEGYMLLQSVIEAVAGQSFAGFVDSQVFRPLGMRQSSLVWKEEFAARAQTGASGMWSPRPARFNSPAAAASLYTTAEDYAVFLSAFLANERLAALTQSAPVNVNPSLGLEWGYGWGIERSARGANLWQWGNNPGFRSFAMFSPTSGDGFVVFTNNDRGMAMAVPLAYDVLPTEHNAFRFSMVG